MLSNIFRRSGSTGENANSSENMETPPVSSENLCSSDVNNTLGNPLNDSIIGPSVSSEQTSSSPSSKKRNRSSTNSEDDIKRQNVNDSFLIELDNMPSDLDTTADNNSKNSLVTPPINSENSVSEPVSDISNLEVPFDKNTPFWVPILLRSFDALKNDIQSNVHALGEEVKSINSKFEKFCTDTSNRISSIENKVILSEDKLEKCEKSLASFEQVSESQSKIVMELEKSVNFLSQNYDNFKKEIHGLTTKNANLEKSVENLSLQLDSNEQHNRNQCLLLHGVPESDKETPAQCKTLFAKNVSEKLNTAVHEGYIVRAHRLGKRKSNGKPRPLIARISSFELRSFIFYNKKLFKNSPMSITENLTKRRMNEKAKAVSVYGESNVWTREGRIYAKDAQSGEVKNVFS